MLDIKYIRENKDFMTKVVAQKGANIDIGKLFDVDEKRLQILAQVEELRKQRNEVSKLRDVEKGKQIKSKLEGLEKNLEEITSQFNSLMIYVPNIPSEDTPIGKDDSENKVLRKWGEPTPFDFQPKDHMELGEALDLIDTETASKVSGSRFAYLKGPLAVLQFALIQYAFKVLQDEKVLRPLAEKFGLNPKGFIPVIPPVMIRPEVYVKMARLDPQQAEERYHLPSDDLYLIGSAEHTLGPLHMDQTLEEGNLPIRYVGYSTSFRREAGSYGKDIKGILRLHQFDKVEMETFSLPEDSLKEQDFIVAIQEYLMQSLGIPYQVVICCTGDMGGPDARQLDIECWLPGQNRYRETHSADLMTDYQSRRLGTKVRRKKEGKLEYVHINDATVFAIGRTLIAILENFQQADGSVKIPQVLVPFTGFSEIKPKE